MELRRLLDPQPMQIRSWRTTADVGARMQAHPRRPPGQTDPGPLQLWGADPQRQRRGSSWLGWWVGRRTLKRKSWMITSGESDQLPHVSPSHLPRNMLPSRPASKQRTNDAKRSVLRPAAISNRAMQSTVSTLDRKNTICHQLHCIALQERTTASSEPPTFHLDLTTASVIPHSTTDVYC